MNATTAFLCIMTLSLVSITSSAQSETNAASASEGGLAFWWWSGKAGATERGFRADAGRDALSR